MRGARTQRGARVEISRRARLGAFNHEMSDLPPFQTLLDRHAAEVMAVLRGAVGRDGAEDCFQETFLAALRAYPRLQRRREPARLAADDRPPQGDRPPPRQRPSRRCRSPTLPRSRLMSPAASATGDLGSGRRAAAKQRAAVDAALRLRPAPRRDRRRPRLLPGGRPAQPARGHEATEKGAGMNDSAHDLAWRASAPPPRDCSTSPTRPPTRPSATLLLAATPQWAGAGRPAQPGRRRAARRISPSGSRRGCSRRPPGSIRPAASSTSTSRAACVTSSCRSTGS